MKKYVLKASGNKELYSEGKIYSSLLKAGASTSLASKTVKEVQSKLNGEIGTDKVYNSILEQLTDTEPQIASISSPLAYLFFNTSNALLVQKLNLIK